MFLEFPRHINLHKTRNLKTTTVKKDTQKDIGETNCLRRNGQETLRRIRNR